jgi:hypothetical protein
MCVMLQQLVLARVLAAMLHCCGSCCGVMPLASCSHCYLCAAAAAAAAAALLCVLLLHQVDNEPSIRANTTVLLGNIAQYLGDTYCKKVCM